MLTKEKFIEVIEKIQEIDDLSNAINSLYYTSKNEIIRDFANASFMTVNSSLVVELLEFMFNDNDANWISYYCWELNFGRDSKIDSVTNLDGTPIPMESTSDLYNFLISSR